MPEATEYIWKNKKIELGFWDAEDTDTSYITLYWGGNTEIEEATVHAEVNVYQTPAASSCVDIYMNDERIIDISCWGDCEVSKQQGVLDLLVNGINIFEVRVYKCPVWHPWDVEAVITAYLVVKYIGDEPYVVPIDIWTTLAIGAGIGGLMIGLWYGGRK